MPKTSKTTAKTRHEAGPVTDAEDELAGYGSLDAMGRRASCRTPFVIPTLDRNHP